MTFSTFPIYSLDIDFILCPYIAGLEPAPFFSRRRCRRRLAGGFLGSKTAGWPPAQPAPAPDFIFRRPAGGLFTEKPPVFRRQTKSGGPAGRRLHKKMAQNRRLTAGPAGEKAGAGWPPASRRNFRSKTAGWPPAKTQPAPAPVASLL